MSNELARKDWGRLYVPNCILSEMREDRNSGHTNFTFWYDHYSDFGTFTVEGRFEDGMWLVRAVPIDFPQLGDVVALNVLLTNVEINRPYPYGNSPLELRPERPKLILRGNVLRAPADTNLDPPRSDLGQIFKEMTDGRNED